MTLLHRVCAHLEGNGVAHAVIGALALAARGHPRATADFDVLVYKTAPFSYEFWAPLSQSGVQIEIRRGDDEDPLEGVVELDLAGEVPVGVIGGRGRWNRGFLERATGVEVLGREVPVVGLVDLIGLKLLAGGTRDREDVRRLLEGLSEGETEGVDALLLELPEPPRRLWGSLRGGG